MSKLKLVVYNTDKTAVRDILSINGFHVSQGVGILTFTSEVEADKFVRPLLEPEGVAFNRKVVVNLSAKATYEIMIEADLYRSKDKRIYAYLMHEWWAEMCKKHDRMIPILGDDSWEDDENLTILENYLVPDHDVYYTLLTNSDGELWATVHANY